MGPGMFDGMFEGLAKCVGCLFGLLFLFVPLGLWKMVDIIIWLFKNVNISLG